MLEPQSLWKGQRGEEPIEEPVPMPPKFVPGDRVQTNIVPVYVRALPDKNSALVVKFESSPILGTIQQGPVTSQFVYYQVVFDAGETGWVDETRLDKVSTMTARERAELKLQDPAWTPLTSEETASL